MYHIKMKQTNTLSESPLTMAANKLKTGQFCFSFHFFKKLDCLN